jgi:hypothetical protein
MAPEINVPNLSASNIGGMTSLMNQQKVRKDIDLDQAEALVQGKAYKQKRNEVDPIKLYDAEMSKIAEEIGIDLGADDRSKSRSSAKGYDIESYDPRGSHGHKTSKHRAPSIKSIRSVRSASGSDWSGSSDSDGSSGSGSYDSYDSEYDSEYTGSTRSSVSGGSSRSESRGGGYGGFSSRRSDRSDRSERSSRSARSHRRSRSGNMTHEQERRSHIHNVIGNIRTETKTTYGIENERIQDMKITKLEQIDALKEQLEEDGISITTAGSPTVTSSLEEIDATLRILTIRADRDRYATFANEMIVGFAEVIETVFDGSRKVPILGIAPNYTGYSGTVATKLSRCRSSTASFVGGIIEKHQISPGWRLAMEFLPGFLLYPRIAGKAQAQSSLHNEFVGRAMNDIRDADRPQSFRDLNDL